MATASTSGQSSFGLGRKKKQPGLMDQITKFFGGDKKKRSKVRFHASASKGAVQVRNSPSPNDWVFPGSWARLTQQSSARRRTKENAVVHFFRSLVSSPQPKSRWRDALGLSDSLLLDDFEIAQLFMNRSRPRRRVPRAQSRRSGDAETKTHCPESSTWEKPSPVHPLNAGAPSSKLSADEQTTDPPPMGEEEEEGETDLQDSQPQE
ncbi:hypothetical protein F7725_025495, partial [Dissostichus mawsoni]